MPRARQMGAACFLDWRVARLARKTQESQVSKLSCSWCDLASATPSLFSADTKAPSACQPRARWAAGSVATRAAATRGAATAHPFPSPGRGRAWQKRSHPLSSIHGCGGRAPWYARGWPGGATTACGLGYGRS